MIHWKPEGRKKRGRPLRTWKDGIYTAMNERDLRMGEWNNRRQWNMKVGRRRQTFQNRAIYRMSQEECARLREGVPYVKVYRYNPKHLYPKLNGY